jgi:hypothetical protein
MREASTAIANLGPMPQTYDITQILLKHAPKPSIIDGEARTKIVGSLCWLLGFVEVAHPDLDLTRHRQALNTVLLRQAREPNPEFPPCNPLTTKTS